ncbi:MAG: YcaO-like family protein [Acidimicrobiales bacterium]|nr:YcaO-like family protein [Acidimicrobiales bacterium]
MTEVLIGSLRDEPRSPGAARPPGVDALVERFGTAGKTTVHGTHRVRPPDETVAWVRERFDAFGITRVANVTGLDIIGIPVVMVVRPNSRGLSVSQGKGLTLDAAKASGVMECIELWHAEHMDGQLWRASANEVLSRARMLQIDRLPKAIGGKFDRGLQILWAEGVDIVSGDPVWVPEEVVSTDCSFPKFPGAGCFITTSNGLASGNHPLEAISHGLCEVIERDSTTLFEMGSDSRRAARRIALDTVADPDCRALLRRCDEAGVAVAAWDTTTDIGLPSVTCELFDREPNPWRPLPVGAGHGCHPSSAIAFSRALTEAAQSRLTLIVGSRDDYLYRDYARSTGSESRAYQRRLLDEPTPRSFADLPSHATDSLEGDVELIVRLLTARGLDEVVTIDLTQHQHSIPVYKVVVPDLEHRGPGSQQYRPGPRAQAAIDRGRPA